MILEYVCRGEVLVCVTSPSPPPPESEVTFLLNGTRHTYLVLGPQQRILEVYAVREDLRGARWYPASAPERVRVLLEELE